MEKISMRQCVDAGSAAFFGQSICGVVVAAMQRAPDPMPVCNEMIACPVCGGSLRRLTPLRRSRTCPFCGHIVHYQRPDTVGNKLAATDTWLLSVPPVLELGHRINLDGHVYELKGSIRFEDAVSHRSVERWWIMPASDPNHLTTAGRWISFDGEVYRLLSSISFEIPMQRIRNLKVGELFSDQFNDSWLVIERRQLELQGTTGSLPALPPVGSAVQRIDAVGASKHIVIDSLDNSFHVHMRIRWIFHDSGMSENQTIQPARLIRPIGARVPSNHLYQNYHNPTSLRRE